MIKYGHLLFVFVAACSSSNSKIEEAMFLSKPAPSNYVISSPLEGVLTKDGKALSNTKMLRRLTWNGSNGKLEEIKQEYVTDSNGRFSLPLHEETLALGALEQFVGSTYIDVYIDGQVHFMWYSSKMEKELNSEYDVPPAGVICDINSPELGVNIKIGLCLTRCRWDNMPEDNPDEL